MAISILLLIALTAAYKASRARLLLGTMIQLYNRTREYSETTVLERWAMYAAIKAHMDAKGQDRCWLNDARLYRAAGLEPTGEELPLREEFRLGCIRYEEERYGEPRDKCEFCLGAKGGVRGNENLEATLHGVVRVCDYCTSLLIEIRRAEAVPR